MRMRILVRLLLKMNQIDSKYTVYAHLIRDISSFMFAETISCSRIMRRFPMQVEHGLALLHVLVVDSH